MRVLSFATKFSKCFVFMFAVYSSTDLELSSSFEAQAETSKTVNNATKTRIILLYFIVYTSKGFVSHDTNSKKGKKEP